MSDPLALSAHASAELHHFGSEQNPLLIVDNALADPERVVAIAGRHEYRAIGPFYPGVRAAVSEKIAMPLVLPLLEQLQQNFALPCEPRYFECFLSIVTTDPEDLLPIQRLPHFDGVERERLAVLLYLDAKEHGGTAFYRQRSTGFESVTGDNLKKYTEVLERETQIFGLPEAAYISGDTAMFEQIYSVAGQYNQMVIYRGNTLHCAAFDEGFVPVNDPATGRLTLNLFLTA
ncbi:MAG: DUF6445 family protein [Parasphingorhabdus sp.]|nr:DUF6445 family protein [Parasphingorhabdus sp.]